MNRKQTRKIATAIQCARDVQRSRTYRAVSTIAIVASATVLGVATPRYSHAASATWSATGASTAWLTAGSWTPSGAPGSSAAVTANLDVATFNVTGTGGTPSAPIGINFNTVAGNFGLGEIVIDGRSRVFTNSASTVPGTLTLNGALDGGNNVFLSNTSSTANAFSMTLQNGTPVMNIAFSQAGMLNVTNAGASMVISSTITSAGGNVTKIGGGSLTLSGPSNNFGANSLLLNGGTTFINNASSGVALTAGAITAASGTVLGGNGFVNAAVSIGGTIAPDTTATPSANTFSINGGLSFNTGTVGNFDISSTAKDKVAITGNLSLPATPSSVTINVNDLGGGVAPATIPLFTYTGSLTNFSALTLGTTPGGGATYSLVNNANEVDLLVQLPVSTLIWKGQTNGNWDQNNSANWTGNVSGKFTNGDFTSFDDTATGPTTIAVGAAGVAPGAMTFTNSTLAYTINGPGAISGGSGLVKSGSAQLTINSSNSYSGGTTFSAGTLTVGSATALGTGTVAISNNSVLQYGANVTIANAISVDGGGATIDSNGHTVGISGVIGGGGNPLTKIGAGTLTLSTPTTSFGGQVTINGGTLSLSGINANGGTGVGTGAVTVNTGGTLEINGIHAGFKPDNSIGTALVTTVNDGGTLQGRGDAWLTGSGGFKFATSGNMFIAAPGVGDKLLTGNSIRNPAGGQTSTAVITVTGAGDVFLGSGGTSQSTAGTQYSGSWVVAMDNTTGIFQLGPVLAGGFGELLNALGYQAPTQAGLPATYSGITRPLTLNTGTIAFGSDTPNFGASTHPAAISYRSPMTINGGKLASTGVEISTGSVANAGATLTTTPVTANLAADITLSAGASAGVLLYDPAPGATAGGRSLNIMTDPNALTPGPNSGDPAVAVSDNFTWGAGSTLAVTANGNTGGALNFSRTTGTVTVTAPASLTIDATSAVNVGKTLPPGPTSVLTTVAGTIDPFTDSTAVGNDVTKSVSATISGTLTYAAQASGAGIKTYRLGGAAINTGGKLVLEAPAATIDRTILVSGPITTSGTGSIDIGRNEILTTTTFANLKALVTTGKIFTTQTEPGLTVGVGYLDKGGGITEARYALKGDTNLDDTVDVGDLGALATNYNNTGGQTWAQGDFDYNGNVDVGDLGALATNYNAGLGGGAAVLSAAEPLAVAAGAAVPEPTSLGLLGLGAVSLMGRRRRRA